MPKTGSENSLRILEKIARNIKSIAHFVASTSSCARVFYTRKLSGFVQILNFIPLIKDNIGKKRAPSELKDVLFDSKNTASSILSTLNSTLFYWYLTIWSDCRNLNKRDVLGIPVVETSLEDRKLYDLADQLMADFKQKSQMLQMGKLLIQCIYPKLSKPLIDQIDSLLAVHYGFTHAELDFIINYDIQYRMGKELEGEEERGAA
jgi:hypothetical protein